MDITKLFAPGLMQGKTVFVTGGGSGINLGVAKSFASLGANVGLCGRRQDRLDAAAQEIAAAGAAWGIKVCPVAADVRNMPAVEEALSRAQTTCGTIDTLVCGAAGNFLSRAEDLSANGFRTVIDIDLMGAFNATRAAFPQLQATKGLVLFISAPQSYVPMPLQVHAGAAKAGIDNMMANLALEWGRHGIRLNSISPGPIAGTEGIARLSGPGSDDRWKALPLGRLGTVQEIGAMAVYLASPMAAYITGTRVAVDGGTALVGSGHRMGGLEAFETPKR